MTEIKYQDWLKEAAEKFGKDPLEWKFVCPSCGYVASVKDWKNAGASEGEIAFSCVGRRLNTENEIWNKNGGPCNYAGGGLFRLNPVKVVLEDGHIRETFAFAE